MFACFAFDGFDEIKTWYVFVSSDAHNLFKASHASESLEAGGACEIKRRPHLSLSHLAFQLKGREKGT